ncbi:protein translocase subunit SecD [Oryzifoliimicrobium ureilyticus]|uniref:protein translocase subunit SecD n=1 Tax=Oryzifoliimicrobium ureilyticus TaxID=3113724 RepID=UPI0030764A81
MYPFPIWKRLLIWLAGLTAAVVLIAGFFSPIWRQTTANGWWPPGMMVGVDLQGGTQLVFKVERSDIIRSKLEEAVASVRAKLREASIRYTNLAGNDRVVTVTITDPAKIDAAAELLSALSRSGDIAFQRGEGAELRLVISEKAIDAGVAAATRASLGSVERRIIALGDNAFGVRRQGDDRIAIDVFGNADVERLKNILTQPAKISIRFIDESMSGQDALNGRWPAGSEVLYSIDDPPVPYLVERSAIATNNDLVGVRPSFDLKAKTASLTFSLDQNGVKRLSDLTQSAIGRRLAIILDDQVMAVVPVERQIINGTVQVPVNFTEQGLGDLASMLQAGSMPATLTPVEERTVSQAFAQRSVIYVMSAGILAIVLVTSLMVFFYRRLGAVAAASLAYVLLLVLGVLSAFGTLMSLPGLAGVALVIGIAVDTNVLIFERMREEAKAGRPLSDAAEAAFDGARTSIVDSNVTIALGALLLLLLGSDAIGGFAYVLLAGVAAILFTTFTLTQALVGMWVRRRGRNSKRLPRGLARDFLSNADVRFMGIRRYVFSVSAFIAIAAMAGLAFAGLNLGVDFAGGAAVEVVAKNGNADPSNIAERLQELNLGEVTATRSMNPAHAFIRVPSQDAGENGEQSALTLLRDELSSDYDIARVEVAGPSVSGEAGRMASIAIVSALAAILIYILARFGWRFAIGALVATLHDVVLIFGFFLITRMPFDLPAVAALLTVMCYSLNDTVVIYDRMRTNLKRFKTMPLPLLIDTSINQTLSRTVLTSVVTGLALTALAIVGGAAIRPFALTMLFGIVVGTFSSIYIAAPVMIMFKFGRRQDGDRAGEMTANNTAA